MTGRDKNKILFFFFGAFGTEETSITVEKIGMIRGVGTAAGCYVSVLGRKERLMWQREKVMGYFHSLFVTWDSIINVVLWAVLFE